MDALEINILQVMSTQKSDYLVNPDSSCFIASGIEPVERVTEGMRNLLDRGYINHNEIVVPTIVHLVELEEDGSWKYNDDGTPIWQFNDDGTPVVEEQEIVASSGWLITDAGREALANLGS